MRKHVYELELPAGERMEVCLRGTDSITLSNPGEPDPFCTIRMTGRGRTRITFRGEDERFTAADMELLASEGSWELRTA